MLRQSGSSRVSPGPDRQVAHVFMTATGSAPGRVPSWPAGADLRGDARAEDVRRRSMALDPPCLGQVDPLVGEVDLEFAVARELRGSRIVNVLPCPGWLSR